MGISRRRKVQLHSGQMMMNGVKMGDQVQPVVTLSLLQAKVSPNISINHCDLTPAILKIAQRGNMGPNVILNVNTNPMYIRSIFTYSVNPYA